MTVEEFLASYPQFAQKPVSTISHALAIAQVSCPVQIWGILQPTAIGLFTAHALVAEYGQLGVTASTAGTIDAGNPVSFPSIPGNAADNDAYLGLTVYGLQLKQLKGQLAELASLGQLGADTTDYYANIFGNTGFAF